MLYEKLSNFLKTHKTERCILYACNLRKRNFITELYMEFPKVFKRPLRNLVRSLFLVALQSVDCHPVTLVSSNVNEVIRDISNLFTYFYEKISHAQKAQKRI